MIVYRLYIIEQQQGITYTDEKKALEMKKKLKKEGLHVNLYNMMFASRRGD